MHIAVDMVALLLLLVMVVVVVLLAVGDCDDDDALDLDGFALDDFAVLLGTSSPP